MTATTEVKAEEPTKVDASKPANGAKSEMTGQDIIDLAIEGYGFETIEELKASDDYKKSVEKAGTKIGGLKLMVNDRVQRFHANGWYLNHARNERWNKEKRVMELKSEGPLVLLETGEVKSVYNDQKLDVEPFTEVTVGPLERHTNLRFGNTRLDALDETKVEKTEHGKPVPECHIEKHVERAQRINRKRGVMVGEAEDAFGIFTIPTDDPDAIRYFPPSEKSFDPRDRVIVIAYDTPHMVEVVDKETGEKRQVEKRNAVQIKIPTEKIEEQLGVPVGQANADAYRSVLAGERFAAAGKLGLYHPKEAKNFQHPDQVPEIIAQLQDAGMIGDGGKADDGTQIKALKLTDKKMDDGSPVLYFTAQGFNIYDAQQDKATKEWQFSVLATDEQKVPWMDCIEHPWKNGKGVANRGAFLLFLRAAGAGETDDVYSEAAQLLADGDE